MQKTSDEVLFLLETEFLSLKFAIWRDFTFSKNSFSK